MSTTKADPEADIHPVEHLEGFAEFSQFVGSDEKLSIYRRFAVLGARNLIYLQAELHHLEQQLWDLDEEDRKLIRQDGAFDEMHMVKAAARSWKSFSGLVEQGDERQKKKMDVILRIREVMKLYGKLLIQEDNSINSDC
jgi:hypothetical protein